MALPTYTELWLHRSTATSIYDVATVKVVTIDTVLRALAIQILASYVVTLTKLASYAMQCSVADKVNSGKTSYLGQGYLACIHTLF